MRASEMSGRFARARGPTMVAGVYALAAVAWIVMSDVAAELAFEESSFLVSLAKGVAFVGVTAIVLLVLLRRRDRVTEGIVRELGRTADRMRVLQQAVEASPAGVAILGSSTAGFPVEYVNPAAITIVGLSREDIEGRPAVEIARRLLGSRVGEFVAAASSGLPFEGSFEVQRSDGSSIPVAAAVAGFQGAGGAIAHVVVVATDLSGERMSARERTILEQAVDQAQEAILMTDREGAIRYANPALERLSGFSRADLIGRNPRIWRSGVQDAALYADMWDTLVGGLPWKGLLVNRGRDGRLYEVDATISPVHDPDGTTVGYVGVQRDLAVVRALEAGLENEIRDRALVHDLAARIRQGATPEETAMSVAEVVASLDDVDGVIVYQFNRIGAAVVPLAAVVPAGLPVTTGEPLEPALARYLRERIAEGTTGAVRIDEAQLGLRLRMRGATGLSVVASPVMDAGTLVAAILAVARPVDPVTWVTRRQRALAEIATHVTPLLLPQLAAREDAESARSRLWLVLVDQAFRPVFQPIRELDSGRVVGFEALTRFADGVRPDVRFGEAAALGLGIDLEMACATAAVEAARTLDPGLWLSLNASPATILSGRLSSVIEAVDRAVVVELTEHVEIRDYPALRAAIAALGPDVHMSVDDTGAGYASLRHVLELRPHYVKLDQGLIDGIDRDPVRQALVAGMVHYAHQTQTTLVAEGIETEADAQVLVALGVQLGQGFLLGEPMPAGRARRARRGHRRPARGAARGAGPGKPLRMTR